MLLRNKGRTAAGIVAGIVLAAAAGAGIMHAVAQAAYVATDDAYVDGRIHAVASRVGGMVKRVGVGDNQRVKKGDVLVEIDPADYAAKADEAKAALAAEEARLVQAQAAVQGAEAALDVQAASLKQAGLDKQRALRLFAQGVFPKERLEKTETAFDLAKAQFATAQQNIAQAKAAVSLGSAVIAAKKAAFEAARLNLSYTSIVAPADGYVTKKSVEDGNMLQPGQPLMAVVALDDIWVNANYKETQLEHVKPGQSVTVNVDTYPGRVFTGKVESIMAGTGAAFSLFPPENALGNYVKVVQRVPVKIVLDKDADPDHVLRVGMSVIAKIKARE
jgi:membrane fusion protein, multidrug efflux system